MRRISSRRTKELARWLVMVAPLAIGVLGSGVARARGKACVETGDTVGETQCSTYGDGWAIERAFPFTSRFGMRYAEFSPGGVRFNDNTKRNHYPRGYKGFRFDGESFGVPKLKGVGIDGGVAVFVVDQLYVGAECGFLFGGARTASFTANGYSLSDSGGLNVMLWHGGFPLGYRVPLGRASLRAEIFGGGTLAIVGQDVSGPGAPGSESGVGARFLLEPRVAADVWFTQHVSFGAYAGVNVADPQARAFGLSFTFHNRAFDGDMSLW